jgi:hypothetical protein
MVHGELVVGINRASRARWRSLLRVMPSSYRRWLQTHAREYSYFRFVSFRFVSFRFVSFRFVSFRSVNLASAISSHMYCTLLYIIEPARAEREQKIRYEHLIVFVGGCLGACAAHITIAAVLYGSFGSIVMIIQRQ